MALLRVDKGKREKEKGREKEGEHSPVELCFIPQPKFVSRMG